MSPSISALINKYYFVAGLFAGIGIYIVVTLKTVSLLPFSVCIPIVFVLYKAYRLKQDYIVGNLYRGEVTCISVERRNELIKSKMATVLFEDADKNTITLNVNILPGKQMVEGVSYEVYVKKDQPTDVLAYEPIRVGAAVKAQVSQASQESAEVHIERRDGS